MTDIRFIPRTSSAPAPPETTWLCLVRTKKSGALIVSALLVGTWLLELRVQLGSPAFSREATQQLMEQLALPWGAAAKPALLEQSL